MVKQCYLCLHNKNRSKKRPKVTFHKFPTNAKLREAWLAVCGLSAGDDMSQTKICSLHFLSTDYKEFNAKALGGKMALKPWAVPSISIKCPRSSLSHQEVDIAENMPMSSTATDENPELTSANVKDIPDITDVQISTQHVR
ncbi:hypothetical protein ABEB36_015703 [Hypothenemus hampei]|uniref:THAP-type domain-containing protein n=1 Tax=Hypothenemus hampei TaxID=57062 RepID=A0ABD1DYZ7_HYPHA